ncbi:MAG: hypothetical protein AABX51_06270 [Nanoarchaeota archaeon]
MKFFGWGKNKRQESEPVDLEQILSNLDSEGMRARVVSKFIGEAIIPERFSEEAITFYETRYPAYAVRIALGTSQNDRAIKIYEKAGMLTSAARIAQNAGKIDRAIEILQQGGQFSLAAQIARREGKYRLAIGVYQRAGRLREAAECAEDAGLIPNAISIYVRAGYPRKAAKLAYDSGNKEIAMGILADGKRYFEAATIAFELGKFDDSIRFYELSGHSVPAIQLAKQHWAPEKAIKLIGDSGRHIDAGRFAEENGLFDSAVLEYRRANSFDDVVRVVSQYKLDSHTKAVATEVLTILEKRGNYSQAAELAANLGFSKRAEAFKSLDKLLAKS